MEESHSMISALKVGIGMIGWITTISVPYVNIWMNITVERWTILTWNLIRT